MRCCMRNCAQASKSRCSNVNDPVTIVAAFIEARRIGDYQRESESRKQLQHLYGITLQFADQLKYSNQKNIEGGSNG